MPKVANQRKYEKTLVYVSKKINRIVAMNMVAVLRTDAGVNPWF